MIITKPTLLLDRSKFEKNVDNMTQKAEENNVIFRPHFKTHQSLELAEYFKSKGIDKITVSSVTMAEYFASGGWKDITIAFPFNILEIQKVNDMLDQKFKINLLVESLETMTFIIRHVKKACDIYIKIDTGNHRTGISADEKSTIQENISLIESSHHKFKGFIVHAGHTYDAGNFDEICNINRRTIKKLSELKEIKGAENALISVGDTPSCSLARNFEGIDEIRPGNFVFYDLMQAKIGSCDFDQIAVSVACPVVAKHYDRNEIVVYCGAVHLSKDYIIHENEKCYGFCVEYNNDMTWHNPSAYTFMRKLSQEHGIIKSTRNVLDHTKIGDIIGVIPVHSCLTADNYSHYTALSGKKIQKMRAM